MKTIIYGLIIVFLSSCFGKKPTINTGHEGKPLPSLSVLLLDSSTNVNVKSDPTENPIVLIYFSPDCPYCRALTRSLIKDMDKLQPIRIYMLSSYPMASINSFYREFDLVKHKNITVGQDHDKYFSQYYKSPGVPCLAIYGKDKLLKEVLMGNVSTNLIRDIAFE